MVQLESENEQNRCKARVRVITITTRYMSVWVNGKVVSPTVTTAVGGQSSRKELPHYSSIHFSVFLAPTQIAPAELCP